MRLALGTVQFGMDYGITNQSGRVKREEVANLIQLAFDAGIDTLDTAIAYGESEQVLGEIGVNKFNIISKIPPLPKSNFDIADWVKDQVKRSLERLNVGRLHAVLLHRPDDLFETHGPVLLSALQALKSDGLVKNVGISVYSPSELERLFKLFKFDLVQAPLNILDRRIVETGWTTRLKELGVELHTRSAFLQGLLLMPPNQRPVKFNRWPEVWGIWSRWLADMEVSPLEACLRYPLSIPEVGKVVVGVDSASQLHQILGASVGTISNLPNWPESIPSDLLNPSCWNRL